MADRFCSVSFCHYPSLSFSWFNSSENCLCPPIRFLVFMEKYVLSFLRSFIFFGRNAVGCINAPYVTYRKLSAAYTDLKQTVFIPVFVILYFIFVATIRNGIRNPYLLTVKFNFLLVAAVVGFLLMLGLFYFAGHLVGGKGNPRQIYTLWIFSLLPTLVWFFTASILYLILPPPRTMSFFGKLYSVVFIAFSIAVFLWKSILYYLTLRFSLKADLWKIIQISTLILPVVFVYSLIMYRLGIFRIPFI